MRKVESAQDEVARADALMAAAGYNAAGGLCRRRLKRRTWSRSR